MTMKLERAEVLLDILIENSMRILRPGFGMDNVESNFFEIVDLLRSNSDLKKKFLEMTRITMSSDEPGRLDVGMAPRELIELVAHELQWSEIRSLSEERVRIRFGDDKSSARGDIAMSVIDAFDKDWGDRQFYRHFREQGRKAQS
jgi:hypothetical protein